MNCETCKVKSQLSSKYDYVISLVGCIYMKYTYVINHEKHMCLNTVLTY